MPPTGTQCRPPIPLAERKGLKAQHPTMVSSEGMRGSIPEGTALLQSLTSLTVTASLFSGLLSMPLVPTPPHLLPSLPIHTVLNGVMQNRLLRGPLQHTSPTNGCPHSHFLTISFPEYNGYALIVENL